MVSYTGFGMWLVLAIYVLGYALLSQVVPMIVPKPKHPDFRRAWACSDAADAD